MAFLIEPPVDRRGGRAAGIGLDLRCCAKVADDESPQRIGVISGIGDDVTDALQSGQQGFVLRTVAILSRRRMNTDRRELSKWCCRSGRIRSPVCRPGHGKASPTPLRATTDGSAHGPRSICRKPPADHAIPPHCRPSTGWHRQTAGCPHRFAPASLPDREDTLRSGSIVRLSAYVRSRPVSFGNLEADTSHQKYEVFLKEDHFPCRSSMSCIASDHIERRL